MRAAAPKKKATKAIHPDFPESAWFDPISLEKQRVGEESQGKQRERKAGTPSARFEESRQRRLFPPFGVVDLLAFFQRANDHSAGACSFSYAKPTGS
jgi:hypothetical protein